MHYLRSGPDKLKKAQARGGGNSRGRGRGTTRDGYQRPRGDSGRGRGRGASFTPAPKGAAQADRAEMDVDPEAFCAHMNLENSHDLESERLLRPGAVPPTDSAESADDDDWAPLAPAPSEEPPVFPHPEGPGPLPVSPPFGLHWFAKLSVVFLVTHLSILLLFPEVLSALEISVPKAILGSVLAGASLINSSNGRRYSLMGILLSAFIFLSFCNFSANAADLDIQLPGRPVTALYKGFAPFSPSFLGSPHLGDFLTNESTAFMVSQGDPSDYNLKWCIDCGANRWCH